VLARAILNTFPLIKFGSRGAEVEAQIQAQDDLEANGNEPSPPMLEMDDAPTDVRASSSSAGPETPHAAMAADVGVESDPARPHCRVHVHDSSEDSELTDIAPPAMAVASGGVGCGDGKRGSESESGYAIGGLTAVHAV